MARIYAKSGPEFSPEEIAAAAGVKRVARHGFTLNEEGKCVRQLWQVNPPIWRMSDHLVDMAVIGLLTAGHDVEVYDLEVTAAQYKEALRSIDAIDLEAKEGLYLREIVTNRPRAN